MIRESFELAGKTIEVEVGKLARQADGSAVVKVGNTMLFASVVSSKQVKPGLNFVPLSVDYQERFAATGRIPGGFFKREAKLSDYEVLICRLVDRAIRPLFPKNYYFDTQVNINLISSDRNLLPDCLACFTAAAALAVSDIPIAELISEVRVAKINDKWVINPEMSEMEIASLDFIVAGTAENIVMVEGQADEISEDELLEAMKTAHQAIKTQVNFLQDLSKKVGIEKRKVEVTVPENKEIQDLVKTFAIQLEAKAFSSKCKKERSNTLNSLKEQIKEKAIASFHSESLTEEDISAFVSQYYHELQYDVIRAKTLKEGIRVDQRKLDEIRDINCEIDYLPMVHGSAVFTRGETQSLTSVTLGAKTSEQIIDGAIFNGYEKILLHYNFPGYATGEVKPNRGPGRREIGHGNLALRAIKKVIKGTQENPHTIRIVSDILESNGSSSMATVCAASLGLMDAGVKISNPISGIAMGLISDADSGDVAILSDILGDEDHLGDMDFKVAGTKNGIVACQMDIKVKGLSFEIIKNALLQAKKGRLAILEQMNKVISVSKPEVKSFAPKIEIIKIDKSQIGTIIGPGGKVIQEMQKESGAMINITEENEKGIIEIFANNSTGMDMAMNKIKLLLVKPTLGEVYKGKVKNVVAFGAFVEILPGKEGLLHISDIDHKRIDKVEDVLKVGDIIDVKLTYIDKVGKFKLSRKALIEVDNN